MKYTGKKAAFYTLGCKLNFSETSSIARSFTEIGFEKVEFDSRADVYVINTCSVTSQGEKDSRNIIRRALRTNPEAIIVAVGCYAQLQPGELSRMTGVDLVLGAQEKFSIPAYLGNLVKRSTPGIHVTSLPSIREYHGALSGNDRTRGFLKIQDGCDYYCSFCTVPLARGRSRNDTIANTTAAAAMAVKKGFWEIILTGVNIGDFGKSTGENFTDLITSLEKVEGLARLRLGSIEPNLLHDGIIEKVAASRVIMPHFHIPLQSGSDEILSLMKRKYTTRLFASRVKKIRELIPWAFIGVDVVAGIHGETEKHFLESYDFINSLPVSQLHAFTFSERPGTQMLKTSGRVPQGERKERTQKYINLSEKKLRAFYEKNIHTVREVLFETRDARGNICGFTDNYIRAETSYAEELVNTVRRVKLVSILPNGNVEVKPE